MEFLNQLSDNQLALLGCLGASGFAIILLSISFYGNPANREAVAADYFAETLTHTPSASEAPQGERRAA